MFVPDSMQLMEEFPILRGIKLIIIFISNELLCTNYAVYIQQWGQVFSKLLTIN